MAVDRPWHPVVVNRDRLLTKQVFHDHHRFGVSDVGELGRVDQVTDRIYLRFGGLAVFVDRDEAALVGLHRGAFEPELIGEGSAADRDHNGIDVEALAVSELDGRSTVVIELVTRHRYPGTDIDAFLLETAHDNVGHVGVQTGKNLGKALEDRHVGTEIGKRRCELAADRPASDDGEPVGHRGQVEHLVGGHDRAASIKSRDGPRHRTGCQDDVLPGDCLGTALVQCDCYRAVWPERSNPVKYGHLATLAHRRDAADQAVHDLLLAGLRLGKVDHRRGGLDTELGTVVNMAFHRRRFEKGLRGDAPPVEAGAAQRILFDEGDVEASRGAVEGR